MPRTRRAIITGSAALFIGATFSRQSPHPLVLDSTSSTYPFVARLQGSWEERGDSLIIHVQRGEVRSAIPSGLGHDGQATDVTLAFGLGSQDPDGWHFPYETLPQPVTATLEAGGHANIGPATFIITGFDTIPIADRWIVAQVGVQQHLPGLHAGLLVSFACAEENLRGPTPSSRVRKAGMLKQYSTICYTGLAWTCEALSRGRRHSSLTRACC
jgi:hypothetical protein